ncbi:CsxC family protein [Chengkuizengella sp. SCS-71B]|uniref:CsxC family protein n=1 Tax=Chengkuizengella sp. SCS-71B TaxID=3115290 RepID=UPI0032C234F7
MSDKDCASVTPILSDCTSTTKPAPSETFKVDCVLGTVDVQLDIEADINLDTPALDIKDIDKEVCLTQCEFIDVTSPAEVCDLTGKLFLGGFVRKNIRFSTVGCVSDQGISGDIRHVTVNVPFNCAVPVEGLFPQLDHNDSAEKSFQGRKLTQYDLSIWQPINAPVECTINNVTINERDLFKNRTPLSYGPKDEGTFCTLREKMVVQLNITLTQKKVVTLPSKTSTC